MTDERRPDHEADDAMPPPEAPHDNTVDPGDPRTWPAEHGGQRGPEPTRYGDWEKGGRCTDF